MALRIAIHDFTGYAFPIQLSRQLSAFGYDVLHVHCPAFETPKGRLQRDHRDPPNLSILPLTIRGQYNKYALIQRMRQERVYTRECAEAIERFRADVVLSGDAPPYLQHWLRRSCQRKGIRFVAWMQDLYGLGVAAVLRRKYGHLAYPVAFAAEYLDTALVKRSDAVVFIAREFAEHFALSQHARRQRSWYVVENWAPLAELPVRPKVNAWSVSHGFADKQVLLYSGTLGLKHNPELLVRLATHFSADRGVVVAILSQGLGRSYLETRKRQLGLSNLALLDYQPFENLPDIIASADVLIAMIERDAGTFCVPSKVLTYLCAGRPLLLSVPSGNLAARIVSDASAGIVVDPEDHAGLVAAAVRLLGCPDLAQHLASNGREYATSTFDINSIGRRFEQILTDTVGQSRGRPVWEW